MIDGEWRCDHPKDLPGRSRAGVPDDPRGIPRRAPPSGLCSGIAAALHDGWSSEPTRFQSITPASGITCSEPFPHRLSRSPQLYHQRSVPGGDDAERMEPVRPRRTEDHHILFPVPDQIVIELEVIDIDGLTVQNCRPAFGGSDGHDDRPAGVWGGRPIPPDDHPYIPYPPEAPHFRCSHRGQSLSTHPEPSFGR